LLVLGLGTRLVAIPFVIEMVVAILSTKPRLFLGTLPLPPPPALPQVGIWAVLHEIRSEYAQIMTSLFLLIAGPGRWSLDAVLVRGHAESRDVSPSASRLPPVRNPRVSSLRGPRTREVESGRPEAARRTRQRHRCCLVSACAGTTRRRVAPPRDPGVV
jgi:hypothetical protein